MGHVTANLDWDLGDIDLTSVTNYNWNRNIFRFDGDSVSNSGPQGVYATRWSSSMRSRASSASSRASIRP
ncbi:MAG: hypothetical protein U1F11_16350 [Steroidobacteraceae bacterium]